MYSQVDLDSGFGSQDSQNLHFSTFCKHAGQHHINDPSILWWSQFLEGRFTSLRKIQVFILILALVQRLIWGLLSLSGLRIVLSKAARFTLLKLSNSLSMSSTDTAVGSCLLLYTPNKNKNIWAVPNLFHCHNWSSWKITFPQKISYIIISYFMCNEN
jgi:hypothetical protein